jgi:acetyl esterase/lipase
MKYIFRASPKIVMRAFTSLLLMAALSHAQQRVERLWSGDAPGALGKEDRDIPTLALYPASQEKAVGTGVIVCPGGGYASLAMDHEGKQIAEWLNNIGISAFVLKYRLGPRYHHPAPLTDIQRAIRFVRHQGKQFNVAANRLGVWGFSAGGHLASTAATHFDKGDSGAKDELDRISSRPDFAVLAYPVISFTTEYVHKGSRRNLFGEPFDEKLAGNLSNETQVTPETPPTFLFHTNEDSGVPPENSVLFYLALRKAKVPAEMHIYEKGRHGVGLAPADPILSSWAGRLADWFKTRGLLARP